MNKHIFITGIGAVGVLITKHLGGWDASLGALCFFMVADYITGLIVAGIFQKSTKTKTGALESRAGFKGLCRKCVTLVLVMVAYKLDILLGMDVIRNGVIIAFICNELISLIENVGLMGVPVPSKLINAIDILKKESEGDTYGKNSNRRRTR